MCRLWLLTNIDSVNDVYLSVRYVIKEILIRYIHVFNVIKISLKKNKKHVSRWNLWLNTSVGGCCRVGRLFKGMHILVQCVLTLSISSKDYHFLIFLQISCAIFHELLNMYNRHVCTHLIVFFMIIPNMVMNLNNLEEICNFLPFLWTSLTCRLQPVVCHAVESIHILPCGPVRNLLELLIHYHLRIGKAVTIWNVPGLSK